MFFHDVPNGAEWAKALGPHAWATKIAPATGTAYMTIPCAYLLCKNDRAIPFEVQQMLIHRAREGGAQFETEIIETAQTPWLAAPDQFVAYIKKHAMRRV